MWSKEDRGYKTKCWLWQGALHKGYGHCNPNNYLGEQFVHRWMYKKYVGSIPQGFEPDHLCNIRACGRPSHLELVTKTENIRRRDLRSPYIRSPVGRHACRHLTFKVAQQIRSMHKKTGLSYAKLGRKFGVSKV